VSTKERPIIFSGPMVQAILEGKKTQTRRRVVGQRDMEFDPADPHFGPYWLPYATEAEGEDAKVRCPYGKPGDRLWVRETFCIESSKEVAYEPPYNDGRPIRHHDDPGWGPWWEQPHYRATDPPPELEIGSDEPGCRWRPSIHMPRWASRITLEITGVRVERLQEISETDARAEGVTEDAADNVLAMAEAMNQREPDPYAFAFKTIWESIHGFDSWDANPWVWVVEFRRVEVEP
jgi:hypothetical protein